MSLFDNTLQTFTGVEQRVLQRAIVQALTQGAYTLLTNSGSEQAMNMAIKDVLVAFGVSYGTEYVLDNTPMIARNLDEAEMLTLNTLIQTGVYGFYKLKESPDRVFYAEDRARSVYDDMIVYGLANLGAHHVLGK